MKKKTIIIISAIVIVVIAVVLISGNLRRQAANTVTVNEVKVERRDISNVITGKATIMPNDSYSITSLVAGDVLSAPFEEGDTVKKGDVLYRLDDSDIVNSLNSADVNMQRSEITYNDAVKSKNDLTLYSNYTGTVKELYVNPGDNISAGKEIAKIQDNRNMLLEVPFNEADANNIYPGQSAVVTMVDTAGSLSGTVTKVNANTEVKNGYATVRMVTIQVSNPGGLAGGTRGIASVGGISCNDYGQFKNITEETIVAKASGEIQSLNIREGGMVYKNDLVLQLKSDTVNSSVQNAGLAIQESALSKEKIKKQQDNYVITAPISGTIITKNIKAGDKLDNSSMAASTTPMAVIYDLSQLKFDLDIDEIDIAKIFVGQEVEITADAIEGKTFTGYVDKVGIDGKAENGVTNYPVTVVVEDYGDLLPGMNIEASIVAQKAENVLAIPISAVRQNDEVYVKGEKDSEDDKAPEGYKTVKVQVGITDSEYIEVKSGLKEHDIIRDADTKVLSEFEKMMEMQNSMHGGGGGEPPEGAAPDGM